METKTNTTKFKPGQGGRPKGVKNKVTREVQERVEWMLELADERIEECIAKLRPKELVDLSVSLQEFIRPKLQRTSLDINTEDKEIRQITFNVIRSADPAVQAAGDQEKTE
jgi:hypothetical protein